MTGSRLVFSPFVICPNHVSYLDAFALGHSYFAGWTRFLFVTPLERLFSRATQIVPVDPNRAVLASIADAAAVLRHGKTLVWFPEGRVSPDGDFWPFQPGIGACWSTTPYRLCRPRSAAPQQHSL